MPEICRFGGVRVAVFSNDHPPPHVHAVYAGASARVGIAPVVILDGELPSRIESQVLEWARRNRSDLVRAWNQARDRVAVDRVGS